MRLTVLGASGGWPTADLCCSGYLVEADGYRLLIDPGYGTLPRLMQTCEVDQLDAVVISHGHPDHCADLNPLLRARVFGHRRDDSAPDPLPVYAPAGALDRVLNLDQIRSVSRHAEVNVVGDGSSIQLGPLSITTVLLPHHVVNVGMRIAADDVILSYTGDSGDCADRTALAKGSTVLLAEATYLDQPPPDELRYLSSVRQVAHQALEGSAGWTVLTHLWPGSVAARSLEVANEEGLFAACVAHPDLVIEVGETPAAALPDSEPEYRPRRALPS